MGNQSFVGIFVIFLLVLFFVYSLLAHNWRSFDDIDLVQLHGSGAAPKERGKADNNKTTTLQKKVKNQNKSLKIKPISDVTTSREKHPVTVIPDDQCTMEWRTRHVRQACDKLGLGVNMTLAERANFIKYSNKRYIFDEHHKLIYCAITKCGTSMMRRSLCRSVAPELEKCPPYYGMKRAGGFTVKEIVKRLETYMTLIQVRHPLDRLISSYNYRIRFVHNYDRPPFTEISRLASQYFNHTVTNPSKELSLGEFVHLIGSEPDVFRDIHWRKYMEECHPCVVNFNYIIRFETVSDDFPKVLRRLGHPNLTNIRTSALRNDITDKLSDATMKFRKISDETINRAFDVYGRDMDVFGYTWNKKDGAGCTTVSKSGRCC